MSINTDELKKLQKCLNEMISTLEEKKETSEGLVDALSDNGVPACTHANHHAMVTYGWLEGNLEMIDAFLPLLNNIRSVLEASSSGTST